jgi:MFS family permease
MTMSGVSNGPERSTSPVPLWRNRNYLLLWSGQSISWLGSGISQLAFPILALALTGSAAQAGFIGALELIPQLLFGLVAGALVDRWNRKWVMIFCDTGRALLFAGLALALVLRSFPTLLLYLLVPIEGTFAVFFDLAASARLPHVVTQEQLPTAVAQDQTSLAVTSLLSPSLAGVLYSLANSLPFLADALSYVVSVCSLFFIQTTFHQERTVGPRTFHVEIREGLLWFWHQPLVRVLALLVGGVGFTGGGHTLLLIVLAQHQHASPAVIGLMFSIAGIGSILGSQLAPLIQKRSRFGWMNIGGCVAFALLWPFYAIAPSPLALGAIFAGLAFVSVILNVALFSTLPCRSLTFKKPTRVPNS